MSTLSAPLTRRLVAGLAWAGASACAPQAPEPGPPLVVVTIFPIADLTAMVGGDAVRVETLLPPRASLHTWEATPGQIRSLGQAKGYITVGGGLDGWLEGLGTDAPGLRTLRLTDGMTLRRAQEEHPYGSEEAAGTGDPHVWLDPIRVRDEMLPAITDLLVELVPEHEADLRARGIALADSLTALDEEIRLRLAARRQDGFVATHDAWHYFAERYGLRPIGSLYEGPGHEPSARGLARLVDAGRAAGLGAVLSEPQLSETAARTLAGEIGAEVVMVDPIGGPGLEGREGYLHLMRFNARAFARALGIP
ncbi:MAG: metal ABC transporter substrate-binding protein [Longimicrobiales bacterium]|nr:metal ABC transporter substrate-binding protein [Longimicrobiales bacterium]